ncbi:MAG: protein kinase [Proteobacteria bacterium]|nr:protein kinase [Pseudomonadota bacterium]
MTGGLYPGREDFPAMMRWFWTQAFLFPIIPQMFDTFRSAIEHLLARFSIPSPWGLGLVDTLTLLFAGLSVLFLLLFVFAHRAPSGKERGMRPVGQLLRKARNAQKRGNFREAGQFFFQAGDYREAARAFVNDEDYEKAAEACLKSSDFTNAAQCFLRMGEKEKAADLFIKARDFSSAAENLLSLEKVSEAAVLFAKAGDHLKSAQCFSRADYHQKAGELFFLEDRFQEAGPLLLKALQERASRRSSYIRAGEDAVSRNIARMAGSSFLETGQKKAAAQSFELGGLFSQAAQILEELGEKGKASDLYMKAGNTAAAARILESSNDAGDSAIRIAQALLEEGKPVEAAEIFARAGQWQKAARLFHENDLPDLAVETYTRHGDTRAAADLLEKMGRLEEAASLLMSDGKAGEAARIFGKLGEKEREIEAFLAAGEYLKAGRGYFALGKENEAMQALQQVEGKGPEAQEAKGILGDIFYNRQDWSLAIANFQEALSDENASRGNLDSLYRFAIALKEDGQLQAALTILERILMVNYHFRDAREQARTIKNILNLSSLAGGPGTFPEATLIGKGPAQKRKIDRYEIIQELGRGGMGIVYKARDTLLDRIVAYKVLSPQVRKDQRVLDLFLREAQSAARLSHPNIVAIFDADEDQGDFFIIMELIEGESLKEILQSQGKIPPRTAVLLAGQVLKALAYAHHKGIVHRDIKPANLLWARMEKKVKITDFGLARVMEEGNRNHTQMAGTPYYMSPEQILGGDVDHRSDQYGLGVTLFEMVTGTVPFKEGDVLYHHVHSGPPSPLEYEPSLPPSLSRFILRCIEKDPGNRFPDVGAALAELKQVVL